MMTNAPKGPGMKHFLNVSITIKYIHAVHTGTKATLSQRPIIEQLFYIYGAACHSAAAITFCLEMKAVNEKNWAIVKK